MTSALHSNKDLRLETERRYRELSDRDLKLDMTRGKPGIDQLELASPLLGILDEGDVKLTSGDDFRNYAPNCDGTAEAKGLFAAYLEVEVDEILVGGNSSLNLMHDTVRNLMLHGTPESEPWIKQDSVTKFLCPVPGYDRHFTVCEYFGIEMINVAMTDEGPDMDQVESLVANDPHVKGMWCVPKYSNPTGTTYSENVLQRLAQMPTAAPDFRILCDNAYAVHHLYPRHDALPRLLDLFRQFGAEDRLLLFGSTSKISFAGGGVSALGASKKNIDQARALISTQIIGFDRLNQTRHVKFFKDLAGIESHMQAHAKIISPKFDAVDSILNDELGGLDIARWTRPNGGYFISLDTAPGLAKTVVSLAADAGVKLTPAGATFPYRHDPADQNIRIAPSFPPLADIKLATELFAVCVKKAWFDQTAA